MAQAFFAGGRWWGMPGTSFSHPGPIGLAQQRLATDPLFYANITIENIISGTRVYIADALGNMILAAKEVSSDPHVESGLPSYGSTMTLYARKASAAPKYIPYVQSFQHNAGGVTLFLSQLLDEVAT